MKKPDKKDYSMDKDLSSLENDIKVLKDIYFNKGYEAMESYHNHIMSKLPREDEIREIIKSLDVKFLQGSADSIAKAIHKRISGVDE